MREVRCENRVFSASVLRAARRPHTVTEARGADSV